MPIDRPADRPVRQAADRSRLRLIPEEVRGLAQRVTNLPPPTWYAGRLLGEANGHRQVTLRPSEPQSPTKADADTAGGSPPGAADTSDSDG